MNDSSDQPDLSWAEYNAAQARRSPRPLVMTALETAGPGNGRIAVELGCGIGVEARALAEHGWRVHTFDGDASLVPALGGMAGTLPIQHTCTRLEDLDSLPANDLTLACVSLPFVDRHAFPGLWRLAVSALRPDGVLAVDLFGDSTTGQKDRVPSSADLQLTSC